MKPTSSRTGLHKVRVGQPVAIVDGQGVRSDTVRKIGRTHIHTGSSLAARGDLTESQLDRILAILDEARS